MMLALECKKKNLALLTKILASKFSHHFTSN